MSADFQTILAVSGPTDILMVPIPDHISPTFSIMNCSSRIHFIVPSHWELKGLYPWISLNNGPHSCSHHTGWEMASLMQKSRPAKPSKFLFVHPSQSLPVTWTQDWNWHTTGYLPQRIQNKGKILHPNESSWSKNPMENKTPESCLNPLS